MYDGRQEERLAGGEAKDGTRTHTQYHPREKSLYSIDCRLVLYIVMVVVGLFLKMVRIGNTRRNNRVRRTQEILSARAAEAGVEFPERIAECLHLHSGGSQAVQTEQ